MPKFKRNLKLLGSLVAKKCSFKASDGSLKVFRGSMVLMKGRRSERLCIFYKLMVIA